MEGMKLRWILGRAEAAAAANRVTCFARWARRAVCISMVLGKGKCLASGDLFGCFPVSNPSGRAVANVSAFSRFFRAVRCVARLLDSEIILRFLFLSFPLLFLSPAPLLHVER